MNHDYSPDELEQFTAEQFTASVTASYQIGEVPEHLAAAPAMDDEEIARIAAQQEAHEEENPFYFDDESYSAPEVKVVEVATTTEQVKEDWERLLLEAREAKMKRIAGGSFVVNGLIQRNEAGLMYGDSGSKKTFLAIHMACCIASGRACFGKGVRQGLVFYFAAEDAAGVRERVRGWEQAYNHGEPLPTMQVIPVGFDFIDPEKQDKFVTSVEKLYLALPPDMRRTSLIVIDTLSANNAIMKNAGKPLDENSNNDMALMIAKATEVARRLGAATMFIHHSGKDSERGARGASALRANMGFEIKVRSIKGQTGVILEPTKIKMAQLLPKRKVNFTTQNLPRELLEERRLARAELCPDEDGGWQTEEYETTLVPVNRLAPVNVEDEQDDMEKGAKAKKEMTHGQKVAVFIRSQASYHGVDRDTIVNAMVSTKAIQDRQRVTRAIKDALDRQWITQTNAGKFKHNQSMMAWAEDEAAFTQAWTPPSEFPS